MDVSREQLKMPAAGDAYFFLGYIAGYLEQNGRLSYDEWNDALAAADRMRQVTRD